MRLQMLNTFFTTFNLLSQLWFIAKECALNLHGFIERFAVCFIDTQIDFHS